MAFTEDCPATTVNGLQAPAWHVPPRQLCPHAPQLDALLAVSIQAEPHRVFVHWQLPFTQLGVAPVHAIHDAPHAASSLSALQLVPHL